MFHKVDTKFHKVFSPQRGKVFAKFTKFTIAKNRGLWPTYYS